MKCLNCNSLNTISRAEEGDTYFECKWCGLIIENGIETRKGRNIRADMDKWLYPEDLDNEDLVVNIYYDEFESKYCANFYPLDENWRDIVTKNGGKDGKQSIHDILEQQG